MLQRLICAGAVLFSCSMLAGEKDAPPAVPDAPKTAPAAPPPLEIYNFSELLGKAERIVLAEVGAEADGFITLVNPQYLKAPKRDPKQVDPDMLKRAADLLADEKAKVAPAAPKGPQPLRIAVAKGQKLPQAGTQSIFFLWEKLPDSDKGELTYKAAHPQNIYDFELLPQIKVAIERPRSVADGRYLRNWDRAMAARTKLRDSDQTLLKMEAGTSERGIAVQARRATLSLRGGNTFNVAAVVENNFSREQQVYDGPAGGYGVRIRKKDTAPETGAILRLSMKNVATDVDASVLELTDATDFSTIPGNGSMSKELFFDSAQFPMLKQLAGEYVLNVFYTSARDGKDVLDKTAWVGTVMSADLPLKFEQRADK